MDCNIRDVITQRNLRHFNLIFVGLKFVGQPLRFFGILQQRSYRLNDRFQVLLHIFLYETLSMRFGFENRDILLEYRDILLEYRDILLEYRDILLQRNDGPIFTNDIVNCSSELFFVHVLHQTLPRDRA